ncbi:MAG TPA: preprotein translocase subunit SecG [Pirellulales bacterium]|nr:preprotein translocase subunit SecG [Pirellulales bacterium]
MTVLIQILMFLTSLFLIVLILLQRGRGGGLAGALGGMGGQSAFGSKAGDVFTRITSGVAIVWIVLYVGALKYFGTSSNLFGTSNGQTPAAQESIEPQKQKASPAGPGGAAGPSGGSSNNAKGE